MKGEKLLRVLLFLCGYFIGISKTQVQMPTNYLPKEYFLSDGTRDPRHIQQPSQNSLYNSTSSDQLQTTPTYHLNPQINNNNQNPNFYNSDGSHNAIAMNNHFGIRLTPHSSVTSGQLSSHRSNFGSDPNVGSSSILNGNEKNHKRPRRRLGRHRRLPKSYRPPKEFIIYSLPEQSFWTNPTEEQSPLNEASSGNEPEIQQEREQEQQELRDNDNPELNNNNNIPLSQETPSEPGNDNNISNTPEEEGFLNQNQNFEQTNISDSSPGNQEEGTIKKDSGNVVDLSTSPNLTLSQRKVLLGQCMKSCIDALL